MITIEEFNHLQELSKLQLSDKERDAFLADFNSIVEFASQVCNADADFSKSFINTIKLADLREDEVKPSIPQEEVVSNAPKKKNGCFVVPRIME